MSKMLSKIAKFKEKGLDFQLQYKRDTMTILSQTSKKHLNKFQRQETGDLISKNLQPKGRPNHYLHSPQPKRTPQQTNLMLNIFLSIN